MHCSFNLNNDRSWTTYYQNIIYVEYYDQQGVNFIKKINIGIEFIADKSLR